MWIKRLGPGILGFCMVWAGCDDGGARSPEGSVAATPSGGAKADEGGDAGSCRDAGGSPFFCEGNVSVNCEVPADLFDCAHFDTTCNEGHCECEAGQQACAQTGDGRWIHWICEEGGQENWHEVCEPEESCVEYRSRPPGCVGEGDGLKGIAYWACLDFFEAMLCRDDPERHFGDEPFPDCELPDSWSLSALEQYIAGLRACEEEQTYDMNCQNVSSCHEALMRRLE